MEKVKAKKHLGQHFLKDESIAKAIADTLNLEGYEDVLEIGPGMGVLTKYLLEKPITTYVIEIDTESVAYLDANYPKLKDKIISKDFLKYNINEVFD
jgi:16S rRNA (adenine1518-N6/adenine1519-N6)-dimethyltransferase